MQDPVRAAVADALGASIEQLAPAAGGCISPSWRARLSDGRAVFIKTAPAAAPAGLLTEEARSLRRLQQAGAVRVPAILAHDADWLVLEWLEPAAAASRDWRTLGAALARLHRHTADAYGWEADNFIGSLPQENGRTTSWAAFWVDQRLRPQFRMAAPHVADAVRTLFDSLCEAAVDLLAMAGADGPSLLHGDLWSGNVHMSTAGPALIDPSAYYGHREVDLAMAELFGGFAADFRVAYEAEWPLLPGWRERRPLYQLYYLLVHVNLFGGSYVPRTEQAVRNALAAVKV